MGAHKLSSKMTNRKQAEIPVFMGPKPNNSKLLAHLCQRRDISPKFLADSERKPKKNRIYGSSLLPQVKSCFYPNTTLVKTKQEMRKNRYKDFEAKTKELLDELAKAKIRTRGSVFTMLYNPPFMPGFLRRNEVAVEVEVIEV